MLSAWSKVFCVCVLVVLALMDYSTRQRGRICEGALARTVYELHLVLKMPSGEPVNLAALDLDAEKDLGGRMAQILDSLNVLVLVLGSWLAGRFWTRTWRAWWLPRTQDRPSTN